jgi:hypothetical protein
VTHYKLVLAEGCGEPQSVVEFDAMDAAAALIYAHKASPDRSAELWREDRRLCHIRRMQASAPRTQAVR